MGGWSGIWQWVVVLVIILILFGGRGKISSLMGDFGKGLKAFKKGVKDDEPEDPKRIGDAGAAEGPAADDEKDGR